MADIHQDCINTVIVTSIPIRKPLKRWLTSRFRKLCRHNGRAYASSVFKTARQVCMTYRADPDRLQKRRQYLQSLPFRVSGWTKNLLDYMDCQPMMVLDLLKMYCSDAEPVVTPDQAATQMHQELNHISSTVDTRVPSFLDEWLRVIRAWPISRRMWADYVTGVRDFIILKRDDEAELYQPNAVKMLFRQDSYESYRNYHLKWHRILYGVHYLDDRSARETIEEKIPVPEVYKDVDLYTDAGLPTTSEGLEHDLWVIQSWLDESGIVARTGWFPDQTLPDHCLTYVRSYLNQCPDAMSIMDRTGPDPKVWFPSGGLSMMDGEFVGYIRQIPKHGTVERRSIADPNKFLQMGLNPFRVDLDLLVQRLPQDCTHDQGRFDTKITNRVSNPNLYVGSVDLHHATDYLPLSWGMRCVSMVMKPYLSGTSLQSYDLFIAMSRGRWDNEGYADKWTVGQPLGCLPSFGMLALTHNLLLESLSCAMGYLHSPYCILGDDLLVFNKKLRRAYIRFLKGVGITVSLGKSYERNLVEFAGKVYIRNQLPAYSSDHRTLTWNSLFDYQRATGVRIPWPNLPIRLRRKVSRLVSQLKDFGLSTSDSRRVYELAQLCVCSERGSLDHLRNRKTIGQVAAFYVNLDKEELPLPEPKKTSGIVSIAGHPVTYGDYGYASKDGHLLRFRPVQLPEWYRRKFRPVSTDKVLLAAAQAVMPGQSLTV